MFKLADMHCDSVTRCCDDGLSLYDNSLHTDLVRLKGAGFGMQFFAVWISPEYALSGYKRATDVIDYFNSQCKKHKKDIRVVKKASCLDKDDGRIKAVLTIEGGEALEGDLSNLHRLYHMGVRLMTLTWNGRNALGEGAMTGNGGLTPFGIEVVREMNRLGMMVDVSHLSEAGFWDVAQVSRAPFVASHSNARAVCDHPRNLTDEQIKHLIKINGFMGINLYPPFLSPNQTTLDTIYAHIHHVLTLGGEDILGFGCDFDGIDETPCEIAGVDDTYKITDYLLKKGIKQGVLQKIAYDNAYRVTKEIMNFFEK